MLEVGGETNPEEEEEIIPEEDEEKVVQMLLVEERIIIQVIQVARGLINKKFNVITIRSLVIMHMNAGRNNMTKEGKSQTSRTTPTLRPAQCCWYVHHQSNAMISNKLHATYGI